MADTVSSTGLKKIEKVRVECADLKIGMYVCELDRPWLESPFMLQGFVIEGDDDIHALKEACKYVYVDKIVEGMQTARKPQAGDPKTLVEGRYRKPGAGPGKANSGVRLSADAGDGILDLKRKRSKPIDKFFPEKRLIEYKDRAGWREESKNARRAVKYLYDYIVQVIDYSLKSDRLDLRYVKKAVAPMVVSVIRNPDACLWWTTMKPASNYHHDAALRASVFSAVFGRRIGLPPEDLKSLAIGGMLFDLGKSRLENTVLKGVSKFTDDDIALMHRHVEIGLKILERSGITDPLIVDFVAHHHERFDRSGYPQRLGENFIPAFGRVAGLVDCYNAMTSSRGYASTKSPAEAINQLYKLKDVHFHTDLIEEFIHAIGVYPVGALVEMTSGEVAIVVAQSRTRRLRPVVLLLLDEHKKPTSKPRYIELDKVAHLPDGSKYDIVRNLEPNAYGIDPASIELI